jgi:uncharacterized membrane protein
MKPVLLALLLAAGLGLMPGPAHASLTLCNRTSYILYAATSAIQSPKSATQGWTRITPGDCQMARKEPLQAASYLVYARSGIAHSGPSRAWGGAYPVCVKDTNFSMKQAVTPPYCAADDSFALPFAALDNRGRSVWTMNFDEKPLMTLGEAQLAGVKRLLKDNGYKIARIDGKPDKATGAALADFRQRLSPNAGNAELFDALERGAREKTAPAGYTVCNDSRDVLLVALGQIERGKSVSRGWWTVQPGACARTVTTPLKTDAVYLLARKKGGGTLVSGAKTFCTTPVIFEISGTQNCAARGLVESGFAMTATKGVTGYIARVGPNGLVH